MRQGSRRTKKTIIILRTKRSVCVIQLSDLLMCVWVGKEGLSLLVLVIWFVVKQMGEVIVIIEIK